MPGDGSSLWVITHNSDFAKGLVGLLGHPQAIGHAFHITSDEVMTWDQFYRHRGRGGRRRAADRPHPVGFHQRLHARKAGQPDRRQVGRAWSSTTPRSSASSRATAPRRPLPRHSANAGVVRRRPGAADDRYRCQSAVGRSWIAACGRGCGGGGEVVSGACVEREGRRRFPMPGLTNVFIAACFSPTESPVGGRSQATPYGRYIPLLSTCQRAFAAASGPLDSPDSHSKKLY